MKRYARVALMLAICLAAPWFVAPAKSQIILAKVEIESFTQQQQQWMWQKVDSYSALESFLRVCGLNSNLEQRMIAAVQDCAAPNSMKKVIAVFRRKVSQYMRARKPEVCNVEEGKKLIREVSGIFDGAVGDAARMCRMCASCQ